MSPSSQGERDQLDSAAASVRDRTELSRSLAFLFTSGATLGLISLAVPHAAREDELARAEREDQPMCVAMLDLDYFEVLVSRADDALYRAKREGRDRIVASS